MAVDLIMCRRGEGRDNDALYPADLSNPKYDDPWFVIQIKGAVTPLIAHYAVNTDRRLFAVAPSLHEAGGYYYIGEELPMHMIDGEIEDAINEAIGLE